MQLESFDALTLSLYIFNYDIGFRFICVAVKTDLSGKKKVISNKVAIPGQGVQVLQYCAVLQQTLVIQNKRPLYNRFCEEY